MRALGYFPTERDVQEMLIEMKFSKYNESGQYATEIEFDDLIKCALQQICASDTDMSSVCQSSACVRIGY